MHTNNQSRQRNTGGRVRRRIIRGGEREKKKVTGEEGLVRAKEGGDGRELGREGEGRAWRRGG